MEIPDWLLWTMIGINLVLLVLCVGIGAWFALYKPFVRWALSEDEDPSH